MARIIVKKLSYHAVNPTMVGGTKLFFRSDRVKQTFDRIPRRKFRLAVKNYCGVFPQELGISFILGSTTRIKASFPYDPSHDFYVN